MSAWHLPTLHMTIVRDGIVQHNLMDKAEADKFVAGLAKMNVYAMRCRYGERLKVTKVHSAMCYNITMEALLNMLQCIRYQCCEGDTEVKHPTLWNKLMRTTGHLAENILSEKTSPLRLPWGIFDKKELIDHKCITKLMKAEA